MAYPRSGVVALLGLWLVCAAGSAQASGRVGILVMGAEAEYGELADQCAEVLVAGLAAQGEGEIVGKEEFLARMELKDRGDVEACLRDKACLARAETVLGLKQVVFGYLGGDAETYRLNLMRVSVEGRVEARVKQQLARDPGALLAAVVPLLKRLYTVNEASLRVASTPEGASVYMDDRPVGTTPLLLPKVRIGLHKLRVELKAHQTHLEAVEVAEGGALVRVALKPAIQPKPAQPEPPAGAGAKERGAPQSSGRAARIAAYALAGTGALLLATGGTLHSLAYLDAQDYEEATRSSERADIKDRGETRWTGALVSYGVGVAALAGAAAALWVAADASSAQTPADSAAPSEAGATSLLVGPTPGGGLFVLTGRF